MRFSCVPVPRALYTVPHKNKKLPVGNTLKSKTPYYQIQSQNNYTYPATEGSGAIDLTPKESYSAIKPILIP